MSLTSSNNVANWEKIDVSAADGGLASAYKVGPISPMISTYLTDTEGYTSLADFVNGFSEKPETRDTEYTEMVAKAGVTEKARLEKSRLKTSWEAAAKALVHAETKPRQSGSDDPDDLERPLPEEARKNMDEVWVKTYSINICEHLLPSGALENKVYRELRKGMLSVTSIAKMRSKLLETATEVNKEELALANGWTMSRDMLPDFVPHTVVDVYWALRILGYAWARGGNYEVPSKVSPGTQVKMISLEVALDYADRALRVTLSNGIHPLEAMEWLIKKDKITRTVMSSLIRKGWPAGEALLQAIVETSMDWAVVKGSSVMSHHEELAIQDAAEEPDFPQLRGHKLSKMQVRKPTKQGNGKGKGNSKDKGGKSKGSGKIGNMMSQTSKAQGAVKLCGKFNSLKGCTKDENHCPNWCTHACGYVIDKFGNACMSRAHGFRGHPA